MLTEIFYQRNKTLNVEFFEDAKFTKKITDFSGYSKIYIALKNGDCTPIFRLSHLIDSTQYCEIYTPIWYLGFVDGVAPNTPIITLNDFIQGNMDKYLNLSKYIKGADFLYFDEKFGIEIMDNLDTSNNCLGLCFSKYEGYGTLNMDKRYNIQNTKHITIFIENGTKAEINKANVVAKELTEKYNVERVELFVLHCFVKIEDFFCVKPNIIWKKEQDDLDATLPVCYVDKVITTNSTCLVEKQKTDIVEIIDCKELFEAITK